MYDGAVKSFDVLSVSPASSGNSLQAIEDRRTTMTKTLATLLLKWNVIASAAQEPLTTFEMKADL
jgi:hypothetical protein